MVTTTTLSGFTMRLAVVTVTALLCCSSIHFVNGKRPNIVFIVADDLGWNDIGFNNPDIISPNIDKLAHSGIIFNHSYVQPLCSPSRSSFMTGFYPFRLGLQHMVIGGRQDVCVPLNKTFLPQVLKKQGYSTHALGKWHLGFCKLECTPTYRGFDTFMGYYNSWENYYTKMCADGYDYHNNTKEFLPANGTYSTYVYTQAVTDLIMNHDPNVPFFLYFPLQSVHEPLQVPEYYYNLYPNVSIRGRRTFSGMVTAMDDVVGNLTETLKKSGMYEDTIIFFTADNGGWIPYHGNNYPLRGGKITIWEGGTRVPAFVHGKVFESAGVRYDGLIHAVDWFPTIAEAAGSDYSDPDSDGVSQWKSILSMSPSKRTEVVYNLDNSTVPEQGHAAIRVGDYKLILGYPGPYSGWYKPDKVWQGKLPAPDYSDLLECTEPDYRNWTIYKGLFNLRDDPHEHVNLYYAKPDIVEKLKARLSYHYSRMVPANFPPNDPKSDPKYWGGAWSSGWC